MSKPIQTATFGQDGLMFDAESLAAASWFGTGPEYGIHVDNNFLWEIWGCKPDKMRQVYMQQFGEDTMKDHDRFRGEKYQYPYRWIAQHDVPVKKGLKELFIYLKGHNIKTVVVTASGKSWTQGNVRGAGLRNYFDNYIYGDMVKEAKPDPAIFLLVARRLGMEPEACVILEDSFNEIKAAAAGGLNPMMIPDQDQPDKEIRKLLTVCCGSLTDVIDLFGIGRLSLQQP